MKKIFIIVVVLFSFLVSKSLAQDMGTNTPITEYEDDVWVSFMVGYNFAN